MGARGDSPLTIRKGHRGLALLRNPTSERLAGNLALWTDGRVLLGLSSPTSQPACGLCFWGCSRRAWLVVETRIAWPRKPETTPCSLTDKACDPAFLKSITMYDSDGLSANFPGPPGICTYYPILSPSLCLVSADSSCQEVRQVIRGQRHIASPPAMSSGPFLVTLAAVLARTERTWEACLRTFLFLRRERQRPQGRIDPSATSLTIPNLLICKRWGQYQLPAVSPERAAFKQPSLGDLSPPRGPEFLERGRVFLPLTSSVIFLHCSQPRAQRSSKHFY